MGGCATKPKVDGEKAPAPVTEKEAVGDGDKAAVVATREIVEVGEEKEADSVSRRQSLSNLLNEVADEKDKAKGDDQTTEQSIKQEQTPEKAEQLTELPKKDQPSDLEKLVQTEVETTSDGFRPEIIETESPKLPVPQVVTSEVLKLSEAASHKLEEGLKTEGGALEIPPSSETLKPSEVTVTEDASQVVPKSETSKPIEVTKTEDTAPVVLKSETLKPSEVTKTEDAVPVVSKSETLKPADGTNTVLVAQEIPASEILKPSEAKNESAAVPTHSETEKPVYSESTKANDAPSKTGTSHLEDKKPEVGEGKPTASGSVKV
uniref:Uncharacterized protein n=1 Tax=Kalanchoe fedtschenkoi TaxID=63787 RepID=A0A7N0UZP5_KALFE